MRIWGEKDKLAKQTAGGKMAAISLQDYKTTAKGQAKHYYELENELTLLNLVLQMNLRRYSYEKLLTDIIETKRNNEERLMELEGLFDVKQRLEQLAMDLKETNRSFKELPEESKNKIVREIEQSFFREKRVQLLLELNACIARRDELAMECDPDTVLQVLKQNKEQIRQLEKEKQQIEGDLQQLKGDIEVIAAIESSSSAANQLSVGPQEISGKENVIQACLDYLLLKNDKEDVFCGTIHITTAENFLLLLNKLQRYSNEYQKQLDDLLQKKNEITRLQNVDEAVDSLSERGMQLEERKKSLQVNLASISTSVAQLKERLQNNLQLLEQDQRYVVLRQMDEDYQRLLEGNLGLETLILEEDYDGSETLSREIDELVKEYNGKLIGKLKGKST